MKKKKINVVSLFDGMRCGHVALDEAGIEVQNYYASEIDKKAIEVANKNYPKAINLGDVTNFKNWAIDWASIDLLIGGSPCQGFSFAGKQLNFGDHRSKLFFVYVEVLKHIKKFNPDVKFLLENVKMKKEFQDVITSYLKVKPIEINSALLSAQNRKRLYWANWEFNVPEDKGILLKDVVHEYTEGQAFEYLKEYIVPFDKTLQILDKEVESGKVGFFNKDCQSRRVYYIHDKAVTLCGDAGGGAAKMGQYLFGCITPDRVEKRQQGQRFSQGQKFYTLTAQDKHGILIEGYIRKLTPVECERLQTLPDDYSSGVSNTQRYKMLGNGWTVAVIAHIFEGLKE